MCKSQKKPKALGFTKIGITTLTVFYVFLISLSGCNNATPTSNGGGTVDPPPPPSNNTFTYTIDDPAYTSALDSVIQSNPAERAYPFDQWGYALSYSAYRDGQHPDPNGVFPTEEQITEDLKIISKKFKLIRLYDTGPNTENVLNIISKSTDPGIKALKVVLGAWIEGEKSNPNPNITAGHFTPAQIKSNVANNCTAVKKVIELANQYPTIIIAVSVGNETLVDWTAHLSEEQSIIRHVVYVRKNIKQPVTVADNYVPWTNSLTDLGNVVDFITIHTYPLWEKITVTNALTYTKSNYDGVQSKHPSKKIVIGECGWATKSDGPIEIGKVPAVNANEPNQKQYFIELNNWAKDNKITAFFFEAFDEKWKGDPNNKLEPEKHWGLFTSDRKAKLAMQDSAWYPDMPKSDTTDTIDTSTTPTDTAIKKVESSFFVVYSESTFTDSKTIADIGSVPVWNFWANLSLTDLTTDVAEGAKAFSILLGKSGTWAGMGIELKPHIDLTAFSLGNLHVSIKTNYTRKFKVGFLYKIENTEKKELFVELESGKYGYQNDGQWHDVVIPVADLVGTNGNTMLSDISNPFSILANNDTIDSTNPIDFDNIYYSKE